MSIPDNSSTFVELIPNIIKRRTQKEMQGVNAWGIITFMANEHSRRDFPEVNLVTEPMGGHVFSLQRKETVTTATFSLLPFPTFSRATPDKPHLKALLQRRLLGQFNGLIALKAEIVLRTHIKPYLSSLLTAVNFASFHIRYSNSCIPLSQI